MSNVDINVDRRTDGLTDGRTDGRTENRTPISHPATSRCDKKQMIVQILNVTTAFYIYGNIRLKEISILNSFEQIQENIIAGSAFSARQLGHGFHTQPHLIYPDIYQFNL